MNAAGLWVWFGVLWIFILAVIFKHWFARERSDQAETERQLAKTKARLTGEYWGDA